MRKYLAVLLGVLLILSFAVTAFAEDKTEITIGGKILVRGWYWDNVSGISGLNVLPVDGHSGTVYSTNVNIIVDAKVADNVRGMVELETSKDSGPNSGLFYWGDLARGYDSKPNAGILVRSAWIQYTGGGLGLPAGIKIGHMPISLGEKQFLNNERFGDDAILVWIDPTKELHFAAGTVKLNEGAIFEHSDDLNGYVLIATFMLNKDNTLGANWVWAHSDGNCPSLGSGVNVDSLNFNNVGLHANGKVAGLSYAAEADWQFGKAKGLDGEPDLKAKGWAIMAKLGYQLDPVALRASFAMGSGDNDDNDEDCKEFQTLQGPAYGATARLVHYTQIYERTVRTAAAKAVLTTTSAGNTTNTGIANTTYYNLGADVTPMKELSISLDGFLLRATDTGAWEDRLGTSVSKKIGWEVDSKISYKLAKNLTYFIEAGIFKPGDFYEDAFVDDGAEKKIVTQAVHGLALTF
ncbi:MAG: alginate export family protein [Thermodesulfovibrionales bacterium]